LIASSSACCCFLLTASTLDRFASSSRAFNAYTERLAKRRVAINVGSQKGSRVDSHPPLPCASCPARRISPASFDPTRAWCRHTAACQHR
jgi:hypothetical protein